MNAKQLIESLSTTKNILNERNMIDDVAVVHNVSEAIRTETPPDDLGELENQVNSLTSRLFGKGLRAHSTFLEEAFEFVADIYVQAEAELASAASGGIHQEEKDTEDDEELRETDSDEYDDDYVIGDE